MPRPARDEGFAEAFPDLLRRAFRLAYQLLGNRASAEDVAAEALARAFAEWHKIRTVDYRDGWVLRVSANLAIDSLRRRRPDLEPKESINPEETAMTRVILGVALRSLPRRQREVVVLRHLAGLSEAETATVLGISVGTVKSHGHRGIAALRQELGEDFGGAGLDA